MPIDHRVKNLAYTLDPDAWESYSGCAKSHKQYMEARRTRSLACAARTLGPLSEPEGNMVKKSAAYLATQITDAISRVTRAHIACEKYISADNSLKLDETEQNLMRLLTELQERK